MSEHIIPSRLYYVIWISLMCLTVITAAVATGFALGGAIVDRLPQTWSFIVPFVVAVLGLLVLFSWLQKRL